MNMYCGTVMDEFVCWSVRTVEWTW